MKHRFTPLISAALKKSVEPLGPSLETICMLQVLARTYVPGVSSEQGWLDKHSLA